MSSETPPRRRVAILLATYNGAPFLPCQLASILWQRDVDVHIFARDDGSSDGTPAILAAHARERPESITILPNAGERTGSASGNFFRILDRVDPSGFDHVAFADQDDIWLPDKLIRAIGQMGAVEADGYSSDLIAFDVRNDRSWKVAKSGQDAEFDYLFQGGSAGCTYVLTKKAAELVAQVMRDVTVPFCRGLSHDWTIYAICRSRGLRWIRDEGAAILYRQHGGNDYGAQPGFRSLLAKVRVARNNWYRDHILWLGNVLENSPSERRILAAVAAGTVASRLWLSRRASKFRRSRREANLLRLALFAHMV